MWVTQTVGVAVFLVPTGVAVSGFFSRRKETPYDGLANLNGQIALYRNQAHANDLAMRQCGADDAFLSKYERLFVDLKVADVYAPKAVTRITENHSVKLDVRIADFIHTSDEFWTIIHYVSDVNAAYEDIPEAPFQWGSPRCKDLFKSVFKAVLEENYLGKAITWANSRKDLYTRLLFKPELGKLRESLDNQNVKETLAYNLLLTEHVVPLPASLRSTAAGTLSAPMQQHNTRGQSPFTWPFNLGSVVGSGDSLELQTPAAETF